MIAISENVGLRLQALVKEIAPEAIAWRAVYVRLLREDAESIGRVRAIAATSFKGFSENLNLFVFPEGQVFIVCRGAKKENLEAAAHDFTQHFENLSENLTVLDLSIDWDTFKDKADAAIMEDMARPIYVAPEDSKTIIMRPTPEELLALERTRKLSRQLRVMLVDDEPMTLKMIELVISDFPHAKYTSGQAAAENYFVFAPHVVLLDINLAPYSGHDFLEQLLKFDPAAYVVMLSGNAYAEEIKKAMALGAKGFIGKPFTKSKIMEYLKQAAEVYNLRLS